MVPLSGWWTTRSCWVKSTVFTGCRSSLWLDSPIRAQRGKNELLTPPPHPPPFNPHSLPTFCAFCLEHFSAPGLLYSRLIKAQISSSKCNTRAHSSSKEELKWTSKQDVKKINLPCDHTSWFWALLVHTPKKKHHITTTQCPVGSWGRCLICPTGNPKEKKCSGLITFLDLYAT